MNEKTEEVSLDQLIVRLEKEIDAKEKSNTKDIEAWRKKIYILKKYKDRKPVTEKEKNEVLNFLCYKNLGFCITGDTKILMEDFTWKSIKEVYVNDIVIGLSRTKEEGKGNFYKIKKSRVLAIGNRMESTLILKTKEQELEITPDHPVLCETKGRGHAYRWRESKLIREGDIIRSLVPVRAADIKTEEYCRGWLSGYSEDGSFYNRVSQVSQNRRQFKIMSIDDELLDAFDKRIAVFNLKAIYAKMFNSKNNSFAKKRYYNGRAIYRYKDAERLEKLCRYDKDGSYNYHCGFLAGIFDAEGNGYKNIHIYQTDVKNINNIKNSLDKLNFSYSVYDHRNGNKDICIKGGVSESIRFIVETRPILKRKIENLLLTVQCPSLPKSEIQSVIKGKETTVYNIETETNNYIANGFIVHNCCGLEKICMWRNVVMDIFKVDLDVFTRAKTELGENLLRYKEATKCH